jgi:sulfide:quinone oxidoreductase
VSRQKEFVYIPSLIWVPFGRRSVTDITFSAEQTFCRGGIEFVHDEAIRIHPDANTVQCASGRELSYDFLVIATGAELVWNSVPGLGPAKFCHSIFTPRDAEATYEAFGTFLNAPGPAVIGAVPGASCMGAGYETCLTSTGTFANTTSGIACPSRGTHRNRRLSTSESAVSAAVS